LKGEFYVAIGSYYFGHNSDVLKASNTFETGIALAISSHQTQWQIQNMKNLAWLKWQTGNYSAGKDIARECQRLSAISGNKYQEADALRVEAICWFSLGHYVSAIALYKRARDLFHLCGLSGSSNDLDVAVAQSGLHMIKTEFKECHQISTYIANKSFRDPGVYGPVLINLGALSAYMGSKKDAQAALDKAKAVFNRTEDWVYLQQCEVLQAEIFRMEGDLVASRSLLEKCLRSRSAMVEEECLEGLSEIDSSITYPVVFLAYSIQRKLRRAIHLALKHLGRVFFNKNDETTAISLFSLALEGFTRMDIHLSRAECLFYLGEISNSQGDFEGAFNLWTMARPLLERSSQLKEVAKLDEKLATLMAKTSREQQMQQMDEVVPCTNNIEVLK
jgi:tetratricopeptide (TPR) repeat protein